MAATANKRNKTWCFSSASLGNINILLLFDAPTIEASAIRSESLQSQQALVYSEPSVTPRGMEMFAFGLIFKVFLVL